MVNITKNDCLIFESYSVMKLLFELDKKGFLTSEYYKSEFPDSQDLYKFILRETGIINQGTLLFSLYSMLLLSKELFQEELSSELNSLNTYIAMLVPVYDTTYKSDKLTVDFLRHIRNALAHGSLSIYKNGDYEFCDKSRKGEKFSVQFTCKQLEIVINRLQEIVGKIYENRCKKLS